MASAPWLPYAPDAFACFDRAEALAAGTVDPAVLDPVRVAVAGALGHRHELDRTPVRDRGDTADARASICVSFAEQFVVDVSGITDDQRAALTTVLGDDTFAFVQSVYVVDVFQRGRIALEVIFDTPYGAAPAPQSGDLWAVLEQFMRAVARLTALDPVTSELVRLRGARVHQCRVCQSRLSLKAIDAAGDAAIFAPGADTRARPERERVAMDLADLVITQPTLIDDELVVRIRRALTPAEITEVVLDVVRNAANKIAVALGGDAPVVTEGVEFYDIDATGDVVADVDRDVVRAATT